MDQFTVGGEPGSERDAEDVPQAVVVEGPSGSVVEPAKEELKGTAKEQEPPRILKTARSFEDGNQHITDPQKKLEEDKDTQKYICLLSFGHIFNF